MIIKVNENSNLILEAAKNKNPKEIATDYKSGARLIYEHMLKWRYWVNEREQRSASDWTKTIFREIYNFRVDKNINTNVINLINKGLYEEYRNGWDDAHEKVKRDTHSVIEIPDNDDLYNEFNTCEKLFDFDNIRNWMDDGTLGKKAKASLEKAYNDKTEALGDKNRSSKSNKQSTKIENNKKGGRRGRRFLGESNIDNDFGFDDFDLDFDD